MSHKSKLIRFFTFTLFTVLGAAPVLGAGFFGLTANTIDGKSVKLEQYQGKVILAVNTASGCGYTPQYKNLEALYKKYSEKGLVVLGFPSNDFGGQEPGTNSEIKKFCELNYKVDFPLYSKAPVTGDQAQPVFQWLTSQKPLRNGDKVYGPVEWNFEKFLISRNGQLVRRFRSDTNPQSEELVSEVETELKRQQ